MSDKKFNPAYLSLGLNIAAGIFICTFGGIKLTEKTGQDFWTFLGVFLGFSYSFYEVWKAVKSSEES